MSEYKNGVNAFGNMSVDKADYANEVHTGRAVFVDEDKYANDAKYKAKVDQCLAEGFHKVGNSEGGGGGGSSDFSTAKVTVINNTNIPAKVNAPFLLENGEYKFSTYSVVVEPGTGILNVVLFFGECVCFVDGGNFSVSGDAELEGTEIIITGDCTITIS